MAVHKMMAAIDMAADGRRIALPNKDGGGNKAGATEPDHHYGIITASNAFGGAIFGASLGGGIGTVIGGLVGATVPYLIKLFYMRHR